MLIYHGSYCVVDSPKVLPNEYTKDFGKAFYCTNIKKQAERWSKKHTTPIVSVYEFNEMSNLDVLNFESMSEKWLDFIIDCRCGKNHNYDIVVGAMADDQVYNYVSDVISGAITREAFWALAKFKFPTNQIAFCTERAVNCLKFIESEHINK